MLDDVKVTNKMLIRCTILSINLFLLFSHLWKCLPKKREFSSTLQLWLHCQKIVTYFHLFCKSIYSWLQELDQQEQDCYAWLEKLYDSWMKTLIADFIYHYKYFIDFFMCLKPALFFTKNKPVM
jgi:hypothetical protein